MSFFKKKGPQTAQQKAQRLQFQIALRLACCAYLVFYIIIPMIESKKTDDTMSPTLEIVVIAIFIAVTAFIFVITLVEIVQKWKAGLLKASGYTDDEVPGAVARTQSADCGEEDGDDAEYDGEDDDEEEEYDDEEYDGDEYEDEYGDDDYEVTDDEE